MVTFDPKFKPATIQSWNLSVAQQLRHDLSLELTYVGIETYHDNVQVERNPGVFYGVGNPANGTRENPNFSSVQMTQSIGTTSYNALQAHIQKSASHGLQAGSSFTWSRTIDDSAYSSITFAGSNGQGLTNPFNLRANRGEAAMNISLVSASNFVYTTPPLGSNALVKNTIGRSEVSGILTFESGIPFSIYWGSSNNSYSQMKLDRADLTVAPLNVKQGGRSQWLNKYNKQ